MQLIRMAVSVTHTMSQSELEVNILNEWNSSALASKECMYTWGFMIELTSQVILAILGRRLNDARTVKTLLMRTFLLQSERLNCRKRCLLSRKYTNGEWKELKRSGEKNSNLDPRERERERVRGSVVLTKRKKQLRNGPVSKKPVAGF